MNIPDQLEVTVQLTNSEEEPKPIHPYKQEPVEKLDTIPTPKGWGRIVITRRSGEAVELHVDGELIGYVIMKKRKGKPHVRLHMICANKLRVFRSKYSEAENQNTKAQNAPGEDDESDHS